MNQHAKHERLVADILIYLGARPDVMVWRRVSGSFRLLRSDDVVRVSGAGPADIGGLYSVVLGEAGVIECACALAVEAKTGKGRLTTEQERWRDRFVSIGGTYILARSIDDVKAVFPPLP